jgi:hypothetical protein
LSPKFSKKSSSLQSAPSLECSINLTNSEKSNPHKTLLF